MSTLSKNLRYTLAWIEARQDGEMIQTRNWKMSYLGFDSISQMDLDCICEVVNSMLLESGSISNSQGEIIPNSPVLL